MEFYIPTLDHPRLKDFKLEDTGLIVIIYNNIYTQNCDRMILANKVNGHVELVRYVGPELNDPVTSWEGYLKDKAEFDALLETMASQCEW